MNQSSASVNREPGEVLAGTGVRVGDRVLVRGQMVPPGPAVVLGLTDRNPGIRRRRGPRPVLVRLDYGPPYGEDTYPADRLIVVEGVA